MKSGFIFLLSIFFLVSCSTSKKDDATFYGAENKLFNYVGRIDFSDKYAPRFWAPGVYIQANFIGSFCEIAVNDEGFLKESTEHNYIEVIIDSLAVQRIHLTGKTNKLIVARNLKKGKHTITICKTTETKIGYLEFIGLRVEKLLPIKQKKHRIEFIGDSMTCGNGMENDSIQCGERHWFDQHCAYISYGPTLARRLHADWMLTSVSGYGMSRSCCSNDKTIPEIYDYTDLSQCSIIWDKKKYRPDLISICLGQNDGKQKIETFSSTYLKFLKKVRRENPKTTILILDSPMAKESFKPYLDSMLRIVFNRFNDKNTLLYLYKKRYGNGCVGHPDKVEHELMTEELYAFLRPKLNWN
jgi:lysophospholipase L1-like esterase